MARMICLFLVFALISMSALSAPGDAVARIDQRVAEIDREIAALLAEKAAALQDLRLGHYCSKCHRTKAQLDRSGEGFYRHLQNVKAQAVPATPEMLAAKAAEYDRRIQALEAEKQRLLAQRNDAARSARGQAAQQWQSRRQQAVNARANAIQSQTEANTALVSSMGDLLGSLFSLFGGDGGTADQGAAPPPAPEADPAPPAGGPAEPERGALGEPRGAAGGVIQNDGTGAASGLSGTSGGISPGLSGRLDMPANARATPWSLGEFSFGGLSGVPGGSPGSLALDRGALPSPASPSAGGRGTPYIEDAGGARLGGVAGQSAGANFSGSAAANTIAAGRNYENVVYGTKKDQLVCTTYVQQTLRDSGYNISGDVARQININTLKPGEDLKTLVASGDPRTKGVVHALASSGQGREVSVSNVQPGDFVQYWYEKGGQMMGHSAQVVRVHPDGRVDLHGAHGSKNKVTTLEGVNLQTKSRSYVVRPGAMQMDQFLP